ncbi:MAG TPA: hypothetical protein VII83_06910 [Gaiellaceae bacterium]|jgi:hypothetical protein
MKLVPVFIAVMLAALLTPVCLSTKTAAATKSKPRWQSAEIAHAAGYERIRITGSPSAPQTILALPKAWYDGRAVKFEFSVEYVNLIPDPSDPNNGIAFVLYKDGTPLSRIGFYGAHNTGLNQFAPLTLRDVLEGKRAPSRGRHTFSLRVYKWAPAQDGYLIAGDGNLGGDMPMRLSVSHN